MEILTSRDNRWLKEFRVALRGGVAGEGGAVGVEGVRLVVEALTSGCRVEAVLFSESGERYRERLAPLVGRREMAFPVLRTTDRLFEGIADTEHPQGVAALVVPRKWTLEEMLGGRGEGSLGSRSDHRPATSDQEEQGQLEAGASKERQEAKGEILRAQTTRAQDDKQSVGSAEPLMVVLAGVQDPGNVGTILRTAAAFGATGAVTAATGQSGTASPYAPKALRASAGAALHLPMVSGMALGILLMQLKMRGILTLASCVEESPAVAGNAKDGSPAGVSAQAVAPWEIDWRQAIALLVGNEGAGLPEEVVKSADARVHIPMAPLRYRSGTGRVESLNAAAAAAVVLYEGYRQRKAVGSGE